jgi:hypothetical protein
MTEKSSDTGREEDAASEQTRGSFPIALVGLILLVVLIASNMKCS